MAGKGAVAGEFYPNPTKNGATILDFSAKQNGNWQVVMCNAAGREMLREMCLVAEGSNALLFDFSGLPGGVYFVKMENGTERLYRRLEIGK